MGVSMFFQMKMNPEPADPVQKSMFAWMPVIFTFMLGTFPAGLVIYWTWNNTLTILQQYYIMRKAGVKVELWDNLTRMIAEARGQDAGRVNDAAAAPDWVETGRKLFAGPCGFFFAAARADRLPPIGAPEVAFAGRSNVGKSSLINALTSRNALARTSHTPGRTQELIFFDLNGKATLVDMPGYGYAAVAKTKSASWGRLVTDYLRGRPSLLRVFVLIDGRRGLMDSDHETMRLLDASAVSYAVVLTKRDDVKPAERSGLIASTLEALRPHVAAFPEVLFTSARSGEGIADLRAHIARMLAERSASTRTVIASSDRVGGRSP